MRTTAVTLAFCAVLVMGSLVGASVSFAFEGDTPAASSPPQSEAPPVPDFLGSDRLPGLMEAFLQTDADSNAFYDNSGQNTKDSAASEPPPASDSFSFEDFSPENDVRRRAEALSQQFAGSQDTETSKMPAEAPPAISSTVGRSETRAVVVKKKAIPAKTAKAPDAVSSEKVPPSKSAPRIAEKTPAEKAPAKGKATKSAVATDAKSTKAAKPTSKSSTPQTSVKAPPPASETPDSSSEPEPEATSTGSSWWSVKPLNSPSQLQPFGWGD